MKNRYGFIIKVFYSMRCFAKLVTACSVSLISTKAEMFKDDDDDDDDDK